MIDKKTEIPVQPVSKTPMRRPNETGTVVVQGHIKIFDPKTQQIFVEKPA
jgi:hypothetical protein